MKKLRVLTVTSLLALAVGAVSTVGCAQLIGLEKRTEGGDGDSDLIEDEESGIKTTPLCIEYCDEVGTNCTGDNAVYAARGSCINTCNALPPGDPLEPNGNNVECRLKRALGAASAPEEECVAAGPGGEGSCGSNCEAWCALLENECPTDFSVLQDCRASCTTIPDDGGFDVEASYARDDIQCRLIHLGAVGGDPESVHCTHARYLALDNCVAGESGTPDCASYCGTVMVNCEEGNAVYDSEEDCLAACAALPLGDLSDIDKNTVGCRTYHSKASAQDPNKHCDHASPTGDGHCGTEKMDTGTCLSYCTLLEAGCSELFTLAFASVDECRVSCDATFASSGASDDSFYEVGTATEEDSLQCRTYYAVKALAGDLTACVKADPAGTCN